LYLCLLYKTGNTTVNQY